MCFFFVKQMQAYERLVSDWSSDVCSSDLELMMPTPFCNHTSRPHDVGSTAQLRHVSATFAAGSTAHGANSTRQEKVSMLHYSASRRCRPPPTAPDTKIGRASCRERVREYVEMPGGAGTIKNKKY